MLALIKLWRGSAPGKGREREETGKLRIKEGVGTQAGEAGINGNERLGHHGERSRELWQQFVC